MNNFVIFLFFSVVFCFYYFFFYKIFEFQIITYDTTKFCYGDFVAHNEFAQNIKEKSKYLAHPLYHLMVLIIEPIANWSKYSAAILVLTLFRTLKAYITFCILRILDNRKSSYLYLLFCTFILCIISGIYVPHDPSRIDWFYLGIGSPNVWHNPTLIALEPFALLSFFWGTKLLAERVDIKRALGFIASFSLGMFAKPCFGIVYIPAMVIFMAKQFPLSRNYIKIHHSKLMLIAATSLVFITIAYFQAQLLFYETGKSNIMLDFFGVWSLYSSNIPLSIVSGLAFCMAVAFFRVKKISQNSYLIMAWIITLIALAVYAFLAESGARYSDGNFGWSYIICQTILFLFSVQEYIKWKHENININKFIICTILLLLHFLSGAAYLIKILSGIDCF